MKKVLAIVLSVVMLIGLCACGGVSLKGTEWKLTAMEVDGLMIDEEFLAGLGMEGSIVFDDKQATISAMGESESVDYSVKDNTVTMTDSTGETMIATIEINDDKEETLVIDMGADGIMTFTKG